MASLNLPALVQANKQRWATAQFHHAEFQHALKVAADHLCEPRAKAIYKKLEIITGIPWWVIALIHWREASGSWKANIANGQRYDHVTTMVPKGRGPFKDFTAAALDALEKCPPFASRWKDWSAGGALTLEELYNGEGYELYHHMASPYLWAGTQHYIRGKYDADGHWNASMVDPQLGCAILLRAMMEVDGSILAAAKPINGPVDGEEAPPAAEVDPDQFPEPDDHHAPHPPVPVERPTMPDEEPAEDAKPLSHSKISNTQIGMGVGGVGMIFSQISDSFGEVIAQVQSARDQLDNLGLTHILLHAASKPSFWFGVVIVGGAAATIYWRWKDHGRGAVK